MGLGDSSGSTSGWKEWRFPKKETLAIHIAVPSHCLCVGCWRPSALAKGPGAKVKNHRTASHPLRDRTSLQRLGCQVLVGQQLAVRGAESSGALPCSSRDQTPGRPWANGCAGPFPFFPLDRSLIFPGSWAASPGLPCPLARG